MGLVEREDATIAYDERGDGEVGTILLIHGGLFDPMTGERFWVAPGVAGDLAEAGYRVIVPDRRFSPGRTSTDFRALDWEVEARDLAVVLDDAGVERAHVVGGSNGCWVAARLALRHPERIATLTLCWPGVASTAAIWEAFERSAAAVERDGPAAYLDELRRNDVPRPGEERPGYPFGFALLHDRRTAATFLALSGAEAAAVIRATAHALLPGAPLKGFGAGDAVRLGAAGFPIYVMPADPEDVYHPRSAALAARDAIPGARLTRGYPVTPSRFFAAAREGFVGELAGLLANDGHGLRLSS
jgi:pimeloyl-ACP methyl ester carboxylesterase